MIKAIFRALFTHLMRHPLIRSFVVKGQGEKKVGILMNPNRSGMADQDSILMGGRAMG